jgi:hypothetical protein
MTRLRPAPCLPVLILALLGALGLGPGPSLASIGQTRPASASRDASQDRYDLAAAERAGGHTLSKHVGRSDAQLRERLRREPRIAAASTWTDRETAERVVARALSQSRVRIDRWVARSGRGPNLVLDYHARDPIGRSLRRGDRTVRPCFDAVVVLKADGEGRYFVLTSYPEVRE